MRLSISEIVRLTKLTLRAQKTGLSLGMQLDKGQNVYIEVTDDSVLVTGKLYLEDKLVATEHSYEGSPNIEGLIQCLELTLNRK